MAMILPAPSRHRIGELSSVQLRAVCGLYDRIWPGSTEAMAERVDQVRTEWLREERELLAVWTGAIPVATAMVFPREIMTPGGALRVLALAGVCSAPEYRGQGLGARVVRAAFAPVGNGAFGVALFQTGVPGFYEKLGARLVKNAFVNSRFSPGDRGTAEQPWWDPHVMIYPASYPWPDGVIDLLGEGY